MVRWTLAIGVLLGSLALADAVAVALARPETFWEVDGGDRPPDPVVNLAPALGRGRVSGGPFRSA